MTQILGAKRTPTSVRHVYDESREPSELLLLYLGRHCFNRREAVAVAFAPLAVPQCRGIGSASPTSSPLHQVHAMPCQTLRSTTHLVFRRPSLGNPVAFFRPPVSSRQPAHVNEPGTPSALQSKTCEASVLVKCIASGWMQRKGCLHHPESAALAHRSKVGNSARHFVLVNSVRGLLDCLCACDTPRRMDCHSLEATP